MVYDVVIAGRPAGKSLFLACELQLAGMSVLVLERMEDHQLAFEGWMDGNARLEFPVRRKLSIVADC